MLTAWTTAAPSNDPQGPTQTLLKVVCTAVHTLVPGASVTACRLPVPTLIPCRSQLQATVRVLCRTQNPRHDILPADGCLCWVIVAYALGAGCEPLRVPADRVVRLHTSLSAADTLSAQKLVSICHEVQRDRP